MPWSNLIILIPPSEGKQPGGNLPPLRVFPPHVKTMATRLQEIKASEWEKLLGVKGKVLAQSVEANNSLLTSGTRPAIERYCGVVYGGLDYPSLNKKEQGYLQRHVRILSALFGLVSIDQPIPDYKLKIDKLGADKYWRPLITDLLKDAFVIDLLPKVHKKAVMYSRGVSPDFLFMKSGTKKPAGHHGKRIKGRFIRFLAQNNIKDISAFPLFREDGFRYVDGNFIKQL